ncbi:hypothetical protein ZWY2020_056147 [Hordeum vulgare]|nr:hypothetical protein ZWY2020_056147 [Hordeum vulgare]
MRPWRAGTHAAKRIAVLRPATQGGGKGGIQRIAAVGNRTIEPTAGRRIVLWRGSNRRCPRRHLLTHG